MLKKFNKVLDELCYDYDEILERQKIKQEWVDQLREMSKISKFVPKILDDKQLAIFVNGCNSNTEKSSKWIHMNYKLRSTTPEFFANRRFDAPDVIDALDTQCFAVFPSTPNNHFVFYHCLTNYNPRKFNFDHAVKVFMMMGEAMLAKEGPRDGAIFIYDLKGSSFSHVFRPTIHSIRKGIDYLQSANPIFIKSIHVLNSFWIMELIFAIIKPFVRKDFYDIIHLHPPGASLDKIFENDVPRSHMPCDLGGDLPPKIEYYDKTRKLIENFTDYFEIDDENTNLKLDQYVDSEEYKYRDKYL